MEERKQKPEVMKERIKQRIKGRSLNAGEWRNKEGRANI